MERTNEIIDVTPVNQSNGQTASQQPPSHTTESGAHATSRPSGGANSHQGGSTSSPRGSAPQAGSYYTFDGTSWHPGADPATPTSGPGSAVPVDARVIDLDADKQPKSRLGGVARIAAGGVCTLVGVPMLILPGPGLLAIGGGVYLMASGAKRLFGK